LQKEGELYKISIEIGKEVKHPNEPTHNINWIDIYFQPEGRDIVHIARIELKAHGEYGNYTEPKITIFTKLEGRGKLIVLSYCSIHGLWKAEVDI